MIITSLLHHCDGVLYRSLSLSLSLQGNVYVKCTTSRIAAAAFNSLNGRFFAGKKIVAQFIPETTYHLKFPQSVACVRPLKPST